MLLGVLMALSIAYLLDFIHVAFVLPFLLIPGLSALAAARGAPVESRCAAARGLLTAGVWILIAALGVKAIANLTYARAIAPARFEKPPSARCAPILAPSSSSTPCGGT